MGFLNNFDAWRLGENATDFLNSMFAASTKGVAPTIVSNYSPKLPAAYAVQQEITTSPVELPEVERNVLFLDEPLDPNVKSVEETKREIEREKAARKRAAYNQAKGITTADAYAKQKELRDAGYNVTYDGYWGDASAAAWEKYMKAKAANMTPKMEAPSLAVAPSVTKPVTTPKATDPNSPEANRQRFLDEQAAKIATAKMPSLFANIDIMGAIKAEEARKKAELEALMQQQGAGSKLLNTDPHNIQGGYVVPKEKPLDYSKMGTHSTDTDPFGFIVGDPLKRSSQMYQKGGSIPYNKEEVDFLRNNFDIINWKNYHTKGMPLKGEYVTNINGNSNYNLEGNGFIYGGNKPALLGIQLPEGYTKYTTRHDLNNSEVIGAESIKYGKTPLENDTIELYNMYKVPTNYKEYIQKHQNASGEKLTEKEPVLSQSTSALFYDENGHPIIQNVDMVSGESKDGKKRNFQKTITYRDGVPVDSSMYDFDRRIPIENPDSSAYYNELLKEMLMRSNPVGLKKGGSLKKCSCGCKTLLKRGKGGKVIESKNCK